MTFDTTTASGTTASAETEETGPSPVSSPSFRAQILTRRTYNRPKDDGGFETWTETVDRVIRHQRWLWERAQGAGLQPAQESELRELRGLMLERKMTTSGRTLWLGGTDVARHREASMFNCSFLCVETVFDIVDGFWLLLQGCGVGFEPVVGTLNGFTKPVEVEVVRSTRTIADWESGVRDQDFNTETIETDSNGRRTWRLILGDSAEAWAKAIGKLVVLKSPVEKVVLDFSRVRAGGTRLKGYGWISSGDTTVSAAFEAIAGILNRRAGELLTRIDILDVMNWLGTTLSSRRSAEIALVPSDDPEAEAFAVAKRDHWTTGQPQRAQSNNSLVFYTKPSKMELKGLFQLMQEAGGSEPGFINGAAARHRAPWFKGVNPCAEVSLGNKSFCNLSEIDTGKFIGDFAGLQQAVWITGRANYRQTCVNLRDGVLSSTWHELNQFLRLCGVGLTGLVKWFDAQTPKESRERLEGLRERAYAGTHSMAAELGLPESKAVTLIKPSGTLSKIMDTTEGVHRPLGRFIFNNVNFSIHDPLVEVLRAAGYRVQPNPYDATGVIVTLPVDFSGVELTTTETGLEINTETALVQLERYKLLMDAYVDRHNCSVTVSYEPKEVPGIVEWLYRNWDSFIGVSWLYRNDPSKTAADLGYPYLPQEVVTREVFEAYVQGLRTIDIDSGVDLGEGLVGEECASGACPVR